MTTTATLNAAGHVILPDSILRLFDLRGERQLDVDVVSDGVTLRFAKTTRANVPPDRLWFTPFTQPAGTPPIQPEAISRLIAEEGF